MKTLNFMERLFPLKYDFYKMLADQSELTYLGLKNAHFFIESKEGRYFEDLCSNVTAVDKVRLDMEEKLVEAFVTPFDRQDIYSISVEMDKVIEFVKSGMEALQYLKIEPDQILFNMTKALQDAGEDLFEAIKALRVSPVKAEDYVEKIRRRMDDVEDNYKDGITELYKTDDPMRALKYREVYHYLKDAAVYLGYTVDKFHKIVVRAV